MQGFSFPTNSISRFLPPFFVIEPVLKSVSFRPSSHPAILQLSGAETIFYFPLLTLCRFFYSSLAFSFSFFQHPPRH